MKTKHFFLLFAFLANTSIALAWDFELIKIGDLYYNLDATTLTAEVATPNGTTGGWFTKSSVNIPSSVTYSNKTYSVTSIGNLAFYSCTSLTSVEILNGVTNIGYGAFMKCTRLASVTVPNSVTSIGNHAFFDCDSLTSVTIPNNVRSIGEWAFGECSGLTSITIPNSVVSIGESAFNECTSLTSVTLSNSLPSIPRNAFYRCYRLSAIEIPNSVISIGGDAFYGCSGLTSVTCLAINPPSLGSSVFDNVSKSIPLYAPATGIDAYQTADQWKEFTNILPIAAKETETTTVKTEPTANSVEVTWPIVSGAYTYELVIKDKSGNVVCTLIFNAQGQLISIAFNAPGRDGAPRQTQGAGFSFVVGGLDSGTEYNYEVIAKDENGSVLDTKSGSFTTQAPQGIDDIDAATKSQKLIRDGQVLILRGDKTYTVTGQEVK